MRHSPLGRTLSIRVLPSTMILLAHFRGLIPAACRPQLRLPHSPPTGFAAIALPTIAARTQREQGVAGRVKTSAQAKAISWSFRIHRLRHFHYGTPARITWDR